MSKCVDSRYLLAGVSLFLWGCPIDDARFADSSSSSGGEASSSSSSSSGGGAGGNGGAAVSSSSSGGGMGGGPVCPELGMADSCGKPGCPDCPTLVMVGTGSSSSKTSFYVSGKDWLPATNLSGVTSNDSPAFAIRTGGGNGIALYRNSAVGSVDIVRYSVWDAVNGFGAFQDLKGSTTLYTRATPTLVPSVDSFHIGLLGIGVDYKYHYAAFDGTNFGPMDEIVKDASSMSLGFCSPGMTLIDTELMLINPGQSMDDEALYGRTRTLGPMGAWDDGFPFMTITQLVDDVTPAIVSLNSGPELLVVFTEKISTKPLHYLTRSAGTWSTTKPLGGTASIETVLMALSGGRAILAFREYNVNSATPMSILWTRFDGTQWSSVKDAAPGVLAKSKPALALGAGDAEAELLFIDASGNAQHARLRKDAMSFDPPTAIPNGTSLVGIAAATNL